LRTETRNVSSGSSQVLQKCRPVRASYCFSFSEVSERVPNNRPVLILVTMTRPPIEERSTIHLQVGITDNGLRKWCTRLEGAAAASRLLERPARSACSVSGASESQPQGPVYGDYGDDGLLTGSRFKPLAGCFWSAA
jgi:hypothetical protein